VRARQLIARYKRDYQRDPHQFELTAHTPGGEPIRLRPLQAADAHISAHDVTLLTKWRNQHRSSFLSDFEATEDRTRHWLTAVAGPDASRILFMVETADGLPFGHVGLCNVDDTYGELDNIVRGGDGPRGAMLAAAGALCAWARSGLGLRQIGVRVMADNPAVGFYEKLGFRPVKDVALAYQGSAGEGRWMEIDDRPAGADRYLRYMEQAA
jgi:RimJ/RimL family protein N-acetyltransferase